MELIDYAQYKEPQLHEQPGFAYNTYLCTIPLDFPRVALHWHEQMELIYIKKGRGMVSVDLKKVKGADKSASESAASWQTVNSGGSSSSVMVYSSNS